MGAAAAPLLKHLQNLYQPEFNCLERMALTCILDSKGIYAMKS
jgi:hypothetical protein